MNLVNSPRTEHNVLVLCTRLPLIFDYDIYYALRKAVQFLYLHIISSKIQARDLKSDWSL